MLRSIREKAVKTVGTVLRSIRDKAVKTVGTGVLVIASVEFTTKLPSEGRSSQLYHDVSDKVVTPLVRKVLNPEGMC